MNRAPVAALVVVAVLAGGLLWLRGSTDPGQQLPTATAIIGFDSGERLEAPLPLGAVTLDVAVGDKAVRDGDDLKAPRGGRFVEVRWRPTPDGAAIWPGASLAQRREQPARLELVTGGQTHVLAEGLRPSDDEGSTVVAVDGQAEDLQVRVIAAGRSLVAGVPPAPTPRRNPTAARCHDQPPTGAISANVSCAIDIARAPYVGGLGWAPAGQDWLLLTGTSAAPYGAEGFRRGRDYVEYDLTGTPTVQLSVERGRLVRRHGAAVVNRDGAVLEDRAYLVPAKGPTNVRMTYRQQGVRDVREPTTYPATGWASAQQVWTE